MTVMGFETNQGETTNTCREPPKHNLHRVTNHLAVSDEMLFRFQSIININWPTDCKVLARFIWFLLP